MQYQVTVTQIVPLSLSLFHRLLEFCYFLLNNDVNRLPYTIDWIISVWERTKLIITDTNVIFVLFFQNQPQHDFHRVDYRPLSKLWLKFFISACSFHFNYAQCLKRFRIILFFIQMSYWFALGCGRNLLCNVH